MKFSEKLYLVEGDWFGEWQDVANMFNLDTEQEVISRCESNEYPDWELREQ